MRALLPKPQSPDYGVRRSDPFSYLLSAPFFGIAVFGVCRTFHFHNPDLLEYAGISLIVGIALLIWVASFRLQISEAGVTFGQLFRPTRTILLQDILKARQEYGFDGSVLNADGIYRLLIWHKDHPSEPYIVINLKIFGREDVKNLLRTLKPWMRK
jgi:hypothetical protein